MLIKTCPFCGGEAELFVSRPIASGQNEQDDDAGVRCTICGVNIKFSDYANYKIGERQLDAVKLWNNRV